MVDTSTRLLRLLAVLQTRRFWAGADLAERLEVTARTLRRDIDRLRSLGYTIHAASGPGGGYQLGQGADLPPLLLNDDEAVALAVALRSAVDSFVGLGERAIGALVKLEQLLPARLRQRAGALQAVTVSVGGPAPAVDPDILTALAAACREHRLLTFPYRDRGGQDTVRNVEPVRLAHTGSRRWYLVAWDLGRADWRTLRVDRITGRPAPGDRFVPREPPGDVARYVADSIAYAPFRYRARFRLRGSVAALAERVPFWAGVLEPLDAEHCVLSTGAESLDALVFQVLLTRTDFELIEPDALRPQLREIAARLQRAAQ
ncbi:MAG TPA: YafY family protein [bacterium]|nr:YafY family protein [bacterium]